MISTPSSLACPPRYATARSPERATYGPAVANTAQALGFDLMPWQRYVADVALEVDATTGLLAYRQVVVTVPRQSGKTTLLLAVAVHRALGFGAAQNITYAAQTGVAARTKFIDEQVPILERSPLSKQLTVYKANGHEQVKWRNGSRHGITASTEKAGHGLVLDLAFIDEAFAYSDARLEQAFGPAMITRPQPQLWIVSTAGTAESVYLNQKVATGRELVELGVTSEVAYFEWSADVAADPGAVGTWMRCMPALKHEGNPSGTASLEAVAAEYASMPLPEFRRAYLNLADARAHDAVISEAEWQACLDEKSAVVGPLALAFDVPPDRSSAAIAAAGTTADGLTHVEVVEHRSGTGWVAERLQALVEDHRPSLVVCDAAGPAGALLADLEAAGIEVKVASTRENQQACGAFYDDVVEKRLRHIGQPELTAAVDGADRRIVGDSWLWSRKSSATDISPLVAATLARWAHKTADSIDPWA